MAEHIAGARRSHCHAEACACCIRYTGLDVVRSVVASNMERFSNESQWDFAVHDFTVKVPPQADLIFCRDALQHLPIMAVGFSV
jgi:hypothetical protein